MWRPIHSFSEDHYKGRGVADDAFTGTLTRVGLMKGRRGVYMCQFESGGFGLEEEEFDSKKNHFQQLS